MVVVDMVRDREETREGVVEEGRRMAIKRVKKWERGDR